MRADHGDLQAGRRDLEGALDERAAPPFGEELGGAEPLGAAGGEDNGGDHAGNSFQRAWVAGE